MDRVIALTLVAFLFQTGLAHASNQKPLLIVGDANYPPMTYQEGSQPKGVVIDVVREIEKRIGRPIDIHLMDWGEAQDWILQGKADALCQLSVTESRKQLYDFSLTVMESRFSIFAPAGTMGISDTTSLRGLRVGVTAGGLPRQLLTADSQIHLVLIDNYSSGFGLLNNRKLDAIAADEWVGTYILAVQGISGIQVSGEPIARLPTAFAVKKGNTEVLEVLNAALQSLQADGAVARIKSSWQPKEVIFKTREQSLHETYVTVIVVLSVVLATTIIWVWTLRREIARRRRTEETLRESEQALRENESKLRAIFDCSKDAIALSKNGVHIFGNPAFVKLFGYPSNEAYLGTTVLDHIAPSHRQQVRQMMEQRAAGEDPPTNYETRGLRVDGVEFDMEVSVNTYQLRGETYSVGVIRDITERKKTQELLLESEKMRTVAGLAAGMAHEINNPLAGVVHNAEVVANRLSSENPVTRKAAQELRLDLSNLRQLLAEREILETVDLIRAAGERAASIVRDMMQFSRRGGAQRSMVNLVELIEQTLSLASTDYELRPALDRVRIVKEYDPQTPAVAGHPQQLQQVILNLVRNAVQAMAGDPAARQPTLTIRTSHCERCALVEIEDNGPGIPPEIRQRIFEPFYTSKSVGKGTGLGLFLCYYIITFNHGGRLTVESTPGAGARFSILLPEVASSQDDGLSAVGSDVRLVS